MFLIYRLDLPLSKLLSTYRRGLLRHPHVNVSDDGELSSVVDVDVALCVL